MDDFWIVVSIFGGTIIIAGVCLGFLIINLVNELEFKWGRNQFYRGVITIIKNNQDISDMLVEIKVLFKENSKRNPKVFKKFATLSEVLDDFIYNINTTPEGTWKRIYKIDYPGSYRQTLINITNKVKKDNPYNNYTGRSIGKMYRLLDDTKITNESKELIENLIDELEVFEYQDRSGYKLSKKSFAYTIVFGIVGLLGTIYTIVSPLFK
ncbi:hypothetical protein [Paenibacillus sp. UNC217MF]|uniref:hypothetical protein n=1 Tax=Paenibacillus sp. UNC217MF TaxID=1449062 RepID=UPI00048BD240|nr:hypothetical protein [Paenibacillus sp. UNC217MF]